MLALATLIASAAIGLPAHDVTVDHGGTSYRVSYMPTVTPQLRTVGASAGSRPSTERCRWTARVDVQRSFAVMGTSSRAATLATRNLSGSKPGHCIQARAAIDAEIAGKADEVRAYMVEVAQQDRDTLRSDIDRTRKLAGN